MEKRGGAVIVHGDAPHFPCFVPIQFAINSEEHSLEFSGHRNEYHIGGYIS